LVSTSRRSAVPHRPSITWRLLHAAGERRDAALDSSGHAARSSRREELVRVGEGEHLDELAVAPPHSLDVGQEDELLGGSASASRRRRRSALLLNVCVAVAAVGADRDEVR